MPVALDNLQKKIWTRLKGKINPRTKKPYTESDSWAIATAQFTKSGRELSFSVDENFESEPFLLEQAIKEMEGV